MTGKQEGFLPEGVRSWAGDKEYREGKKVQDAAKGSGQRAEEARQQAAEKTRKMLEEEVEEFERKGADPNKIKELRRKIDYYQRLRRGKY